ncbi:MAG: M3 family oligoendopeptidase [Chloroflexi bacterium]|nr:M3 family oligoendopeptidase [Chloroflexota bacterium]
MAIQNPLHWDLTNVYPSLSSEEYSADFQKLEKLIDEQDVFLKSKASTVDARSQEGLLAETAATLIERFNHILLLSGTLRSYQDSFVTTDSYNKEALKKQSEFELLVVKLEKIEVQSRSWIGKVASRSADFIPLHKTTASHQFYLQEAAEQSRYLMTGGEEALASELSLSGANAWSKLQGTVTSQLSVDFELDGKIQKLPMPALINLNTHADETVRRRAYEAENAAWKTVQEPLAAAMNGVKGEVNTLNRHRGRLDALDSSLDAARIDRPTLDVMLDAMKDSFPMFRRYFKAKARRLGIEKLQWWNLFAPTGKSNSNFTYEETKSFILEHFGAFSGDLKNFAQRAFDHNWIDAEQRDGKRGGAFCMDVPKVGECRILSNFDGSLDQVSTLAHELGHGFHNDCMVKAGKTELQKITPMTLAETASIMCETIVSSAALKQAKNPDEELAILEIQLDGASQVIVDIYSRYLFEKEVFERREKSELSADELCEIMEKAQKATYGDGLDEKYLQKWMWTWKPHYYFAGLSFYNFPYAFGLLFATGLYSIYQQRGPAFVGDYMKLLASTGEASAADLAARFGIDIRKKTFWQDSLKVIGERIDRYCDLE